MENILIIEDIDAVQLINPDTSQMDRLREIILDPSDLSWNQSNGGIVITYYYNQKKYYTLMIFSNDDYGIYLRYSRGNEEIGIEYLSLGDISKLGEEVTEYSFELYASTGFFISPDNAWEAINHFCLTGDKTTKIEWISCDKVPEACNY
jgi:hypothetical protein